MELDWESLDGEVLQMRLNNDSAFVFVDVTGLGDSPDSDILTQRSPWQHGQNTMRCLPFGREIKFTLMIWAHTYEELQNRRRTVGRIFSPISKSGEVNAGTLTITRENGAVYTIVCVGHGAKMPAGAKSTRSPLHQLATVYLVADDPYFYGSEMSQSLANGANILVNGGEVYTSPVIKVTGPASAPSVTVTQNGEVFTLQMLDAIPSGQRLEIDARFGQKSIQLVDVGTGNAVDIFEQLTTASRFFDLLIGNNTLTYAGGGTAAAYWSDKFQTVL